MSCFEIHKRIFNGVVNGDVHFISECIPGDVDQKIEEFPDEELDLD